TLAGYTYTATVPPTVGKYNLDLIYGKLTFCAGNAPGTANATYYSLGDDIMAEHMNESQSEIATIETVIGTSPAGSYSTVKDRIAALEASGFNGQNITDNTIRAGALMADIKGLSWDVSKDVLTDITAHKNSIAIVNQAYAIGAQDPGTTLITTAQEHIDTKGSAPQTDTNPHGMSLSDMPAGSQTVLGYATFQAIDSPNIITRDVYASGVITPVASGYVAGPNYNQHSCVGTIAMPFASGNFDILQASSFKTGASTGANGVFTSAAPNSKTITVENGLIVSIV
ncbi:MAG: hypothetical protein NTW48_09300, partial [Chloroflexi bacterium]|nr:hypothetical protein [Chloroflexota bacterium]